VYFRGRDMTGAPPYALANAGLARTFQTPRIFAQIDGTRERAVRRWISSVTAGARLKIPLPKSNLGSPAARVGMDHDAALARGQSAAGAPAAAGDRHGSGLPPEPAAAR